MGKFDEMSKYILDNIGGVGNIANVTHCATRLRIEVAKPSLVDVEALKKAPEQAGLVEKGRQYQIIIGPKVNDAYNEFLAVSGWKEGMNAGVEIEDSNANQPHNAKWVMDKIAGFMAPVFMPIVPAMIVGGMILAIARVGINYFGLDTSTGTVNICMALFQAGFTYFPIWVGIFMCKQLKMPEIYGGFLGAVLVCDRINNVEGLSFLGIPVPQVSYGSTVFPVMLGVFFMYFVYKFVKKIMPEVITFFMTPLVTMIIVVPVELIVLGPLGTELSNGVAAVCMFLSNTIGFLLQPLLAALYPYMVMFGIDKGIGPMSIAFIADQGYDVIFGNMGFISNLAVGAATLGIATFRQCRKEGPVRLLRPDRSVRRYRACILRRTDLHPRCSEGYCLRRCGRRPDRRYHWAEEVRPDRLPRPDDLHHVHRRERRYASCDHRSHRCSRYHCNLLYRNPLLPEQRRQEKCKVN